MDAAKNLNESAVESVAFDYVPTNSNFASNAGNIPVQG